jgi:outer membrane protein assembly factor BamB
MSIPAVEGGRVYMAYPDTRGDRRHYLACFDLRTGSQHWRAPIAGEIITAPVLADGHVYLTTLDGTIYRFRQDDGSLVWHEAKDATSSPVVWRQQCYFSQRRETPMTVSGRETMQQMEHLSTRSVDFGAATHPYEETAREADYLDHGKRQRRSPYYHAHEMADAKVGFGGHKGDAKMHQAMKNLGHGSVSAVWAYQGSKPFVWDRRLYSSMGDTVHCVEPDSKEVRWKKPLYDSPEELLDSVLTPPALVNGKAFVGSIHGDVHCLSAQTGEVVWSANVGEPVVFQPAVAGGRVYVPTYTGHLYCLETGDEKDDGWLMWGASAAHNGVND